MENLTAALAAYAPEIVERYSKQLRSQFGFLVEKFGASMDENGSVYNSRSYSLWRETIKSVTNYVGGNGRPRSGTYELDEAKIAKRAAAYAVETLTEWEAKIARKMGELESAKVEHLGALTFFIVGEKLGRRVSIRQEMIINVSTKGKLFNQFPARIYVDGKFTSEAKFKKLAA